MNYKPPFTVSPYALKLLQEVWQQMGILSGQKLDSAPVQLRKSNSISTIQASLAIEGNTLTLHQVTALFEGKRVIGPEKDILEVKNAIKTYKIFSQLNPFSPQDLLKAHQTLMQGLNEQAGHWRKDNVGIFKGQEITHLPPPAHKIEDLMGRLFQFITNDQDTPLLLKACVFHYELEFIHPFMDGNGRIGRLWQQRVLVEENPIFQFVSIEELIKNQQKRYYEVLGQCDKEGNSTKFIEFSLELIVEALKKYSSEVLPQTQNSPSRLQYAFLKLGNKNFTRKDYLEVHKEISTSTASRDLLYGVENDILLKKGSKNQTLYCFTRAL